MMQYVNKTCPVCGGYVVLLTNGMELCEKCHYTLSDTNWATSTSSTSGLALCPRCDTPLNENGNWKECPHCHYGYMLYTGDPPQDLVDIYIKSDGIGSAYGKLDPSLTPQTLQIDTKLITLKHKEMDLELELDPSKLENIDTIIINGYKYVKEKN